MKTKSWLWPDHNIGKRESRQLREEHNAVVNNHERLVAALREIAGIASCGVIERRETGKPTWYATVAIADAARQALAAVEETEQ